VSALPAGWGYLPPRKPRVPAYHYQQPAIVAALLENADILDLRKAALVRRIKARFGCGKSTAYRAIDEARAKVPRGTAG
jgi:hypothetical protein